MNLRQKKIADEIKVAVASCFQAENLRDPRLTGVCISFVKITGDLQMASIYYMLDDIKRQKEVERGFAACTGLLRTRIAAQIKLRKIPHLRFFYDDSLDNYEKIQVLLNQVKAESSAK